MGAMSRNKGNVGEREIANLLADLTGCKVRRRVRQREGDSDLEGLPGWCIEVKRHAKASRSDVAGWWRQAVSQSEAAGSIPVLFWRQDRDEWRAVWPLAVSLTMQHAAMWTGYQWTAEGSIDAWAAIYRELLPNTTPSCQHSKPRHAGFSPVCGPSRCQVTP
jgi:Holliday junction resolvase